MGAAAADVSSLRASIGRARAQLDLIEAGLARLTGEDTALITRVRACAESAERRRTLAVAVAIVLVAAVAGLALLQRRQPSAALLAVEATAPVAAAPPAQAPPAPEPIATAEAPVSAEPSAPLAARRPRPVVAPRPAPLMGSPERSLSSASRSASRRSTRTSRSVRATSSTGRLGRVATCFGSRR